MTEIDNDKLLRDFFTENRQETGDSAAVSCTTYPTAAIGWHAFGTPSSWLWEPYFSSP